MYASKQFMQKLTYKIVIMTEKNADPNKGVAFIKHLVAAYQKLIKDSP